MTVTTAGPEPLDHRLVSVAFNMATYHDATGTPRVSADFVAEQGQLVRILDVRDEEDLCGPLGHIPSVTHVSLARVGEVPQILDANTCVVLVSERGGRAGVAARLLGELGMKRVAAMDGGMTAWKLLGFASLRDQGSYRRTLYALQPGIGRDGRPLRTLPAGSRLTATEIAEHVGDPTSVRWVKLGAFLLHGKRSCVDGRDSAGVIGTPGGDAGELLLALAAVEKLAGKRFTEPEVEAVLLQHIDSFGRFYMHTDVASMNKLITEGYRKDDRLAKHVPIVDSPAEQWREFHARPPANLRAAVLEHVTNPDVMGCGHLKFAMTVPEYQVRPELARAYLEAFHRLRWAGAPELDWVVLGGAHTEAAVANITVEGALHSYTRIPLVSPNVGGVQMFVNHPQVTSYVRRELAAMLCEQGFAACDSEQLSKTMEDLGALQMGLTLARLAKGLPIVEIRFDLAGHPTVEQRGVVGS
jgi:rhodanese-related sulfurtransferase